MEFTVPVPPQPDETAWRFVNELKAPLWTRHTWSPRAAASGETSLAAGIVLRKGFPDPDGLLDTAYEDLHNFLAAGKVSTKGAFRIETIQTAVRGRESFRIAVSATGCRISAEDTEGIRRGIFHIEDLMRRAEGPFLPIGTIERHPFIRNRISRCFFGPIKRPPRNRDELLDDVDYYPDQYLNRLAHEGINGLWLTIEFRDLCRPTVAPHYGATAEKRLAKLHATVAKCRRYGIRIYLFCIEPRAWSLDDPAVVRHPELGRHRTGQQTFFCPFSETARQYLYECTNELFTRVPELGGMINITHGERPTTCLSAVSATGAGQIGCPVCAEKQPWEIIHESLSAMRQGMHDANPDAELISWLYMPQPQGLGRADVAPWVYDIPAHTPEGVTLQFNFESGVQQNRFGKTVTGGDYWLSEPGPSPRFERIARTASANGTCVSAKIQTGCSHEVATVPFVPVPGLLYRKFAAMHELGVTTTMLCWYFGNYPGLMNRAAGELSFEPFPETESEFLNKLAATEWGSDAATVVTAWQAFAEGYSYFPLTNLFQYYGPMHDGPVWPLHLQPQDTRLVPTWYLADKVTLEPFPPGGDRIGESFAPVYTLPEVMELCDAMAEKWAPGVTLLNALRNTRSEDRERLLDIGVAEALGIQFRSGRNILHFYELRERLFRGPGPAGQDLLDRMRRIVEEELVGNRRLLELCGEDSRLGFHSEAEGYKYYPGKISWRIQQLRHLLDVVLPDVEQKVSAGTRLFPAYTGAEPAGVCLNCRRLPEPEVSGEPTLESFPHSDIQELVQPADGWSTRWACGWTPEALWIVFSCTEPVSLPAGSGSTGHFDIDQLHSRHALVLKLEPRRLWPCLRFAVNRDGGVLAPHASTARVQKNVNGWNGLLMVPFAAIPDASLPEQPVRIDIQRIIPGVGTASWMPQHSWPYRLRLGADNPADLAWLHFHNC